MGNVIEQKFICNVSNAVGKYSSIQGYTCNASNKMNFFTAMQPDNNGKNELFQFTSKGIKHSSSAEVDCGHGNDCAYYNGNYYIARGGGGYVENSNWIDVYNGDYVRVDSYQYAPKTNISTPGALSSVTQIASIGNGYFILGQADICAVCRTSGSVMEERTRFSVASAIKKAVNARGLVYENNDNIIRQGIYYAYHCLYKVISIRKNGVIRENDIVKIYLNGMIPEVTSGTYQNHYQWDRTGMTSFEVEDISSPDEAATMYGIVNSSTKGIQTDAIYQIELS